LSNEWSRTGIPTPAKNIFFFLGLLVAFGGCLVVVVGGGGGWGRRRSRLGCFLGSDVAAAKDFDVGRFAGWIILFATSTPIKIKICNLDISKHANEK
jgi:hypothetical protein